MKIFYSKEELEAKGWWKKYKIMKKSVKQVDGNYGKVYPLDENDLKELRKGK